MIVDSMLFGCNQQKISGDTLYNGRDKKVGVWRKF